MNRSQIRWWVGAGLFSILVGAIHPFAFADGGPLSIGGRAVDYIPTDGHGMWNGGIQAKLNLPLFFAVEGSVDYRREAFGPTTAHDWPLQINGLIYVLPKIFWVQPYVQAGGGWYDTKVEGPNGYSGTQNRFGPDVGAGVEFNLGSQWFIDTTYRFVWLPDLHTVDTQGNSQHINDAGHMITIGLNYRI